MLSKTVTKYTTLYEFYNILYNIAVYNRRRVPDLVSGVVALSNPRLDGYFNMMQM